MFVYTKDTTRQFTNKHLRKIRCCTQAFRLTHGLLNDEASELVIMWNSKPEWKQMCVLQDPTEIQLHLTGLDLSWCQLFPRTLVYLHFKKKWHKNKPIKRLQLRWLCANEIILRSPWSNTSTSAHLLCIILSPTMVCFYFILLRKWGTDASQQWSKWFQTHKISGSVSVSVHTHTQTDTHPHPHPHASGSVFVNAHTHTHTPASHTHQL